MFRRIPARLGFAFRGVFTAFRLDQSFVEHLASAVPVIAAGIVLRVNLLEWCLLALCITAVVAAEMFNTAIEQLAKAVHPEQSPLIGASLDVAAGGVLIASLGAAVVGCAIFGFRLGVLMKWWA
ncbi:MAG: diacylglycerol kinase family protein [Planctomycetales bacterium]|nr:diacylglycerol kinase family protein [Planctomycetales bacterium]